MKRITLSSIALFAIIGISGCNTSSDNTVGSNVTISGAAIDEYVVGGKVKLYNSNGVDLNINCTTGEYGIFNCDANGIDNDDKLIVVIDGGKLDLDGLSSTLNDQVDFNGSLVAVTTASDKVIVSPYTSQLVADSLGIGLKYDLENKRAYIANSVNIDSLKDKMQTLYGLQKEYKLFSDSDIKSEANRTAHRIRENYQSIYEVRFSTLESSTNLVHMADIHLTADDEVGAIFGGTIGPVTTMKKAIGEITSYAPDAVIQTGDMVALADSHSLDESEEWFKLAKEYIVDPIRDLDIPFLFSPGNHDQAGIKVDSADKNDVRYGNGLIHQYINPDQNRTFYSYTQGDYHFIMLDPYELPETGYRSVSLPAEQLDWLKNELASVNDKFLVISYHQPLGSWDSNSSEAFLKLLEPHRANTVLLVGHTHDNRLIYRNGIPEYQDGAPCGDWWQTGKTPDGNPMGYAIYSIDNGKINRFYKGTGIDKQTNLLNPVDVDMNMTMPIELNVYNKDAIINSVSYAIDGVIKNELDLQKIETDNLTWYTLSGDLTPSVVDGKDHNITFVIDVDNAEDYNTTYVYRFTNERFMPISDIINETNFKNYYGRFVEVNATITTVAYDGNLITLKDSTGEIVVWCGDSYHPEFKVGDQLTLRGQVTQFRDTKELKLINPNDVNVYGFSELTEQTYMLDSIQDAYDNFDKYKDNYVVASGTLTADFGSFKVIQDGTRGIAIYLKDAPAFTVGDEITVKGKLIDYYGTKEIKPDNSDMIGADGTASLPEPASIDITQILDNINNFVKLNSVTVNTVSSSSIVVVDNEGNEATIYCAKSGFDPSVKVSEGDIVNIVGIGAIYSGKGQVYPRSLEDIEVVSSSDNNTSDDNNSATILEISKLYSDYSSLEGSYIGVSGTVTANFGNGIAIQDETQGVYLYITSSIPELSIGNRVTVYGELTSYKGLTEINVNDSNITVGGDGVVPAAKEIEISELEDNMGTLIKLLSLKVTSVSSSSISVEDNNGNTTSIYCGKAGFDPSKIVSEGDVIDITGISGYYNTPQVYPRSTDDIVVK